MLVSERAEKAKKAEEEKAAAEAKLQAEVDKLEEATGGKQMPFPQKDAYLAEQKELKEKAAKKAKKSKKTGQYLILRLQPEPLTI